MICTYEVVFGEKPRAILQHVKRKEKLAREW
jgi:hypothetical protein